MGGTQPGRSGANVQFYIICHRLRTLLKAWAPSQPTCCPGGSGCHSACTLAPLPRGTWGVLLRMVGKGESIVVVERGASDRLGPDAGCVVCLGLNIFHVEQW